MPHGHRLHAREGDLGARLGGAHDAPKTRASRALRRCERAGDWTEAPVERELTDGGVVGEATLRELV